MALCLRTTVLIVVLFHGYHSIEWTSGPQNGTTRYACVGDDVIIPWTYSLGAGDVLHDIQWLYQGQSQEVIALFSHGTFVPLPAFANRVQRVANGGLQISHVTQAEKGNYSVEITGSDMYNNHIFLQKHLQLEIADGLMTSDRQLHVIMNPTPVLDNATSTYSIELQCGPFLFQHQPPFDIKWLTPSGALLGSSHYNDGQFSLLLPLQAKGGNYTCRVSANTCVAQDMEVSVVVDAMDIRLVHMEARLTAADTERKQLQSQLNATTIKLAVADTERRQLDARLTAVETDRKQVQAQLNATTAELAAINQRNRLVVSFHAGVLVTPPSFKTVGDHLTLATVYTNQGNGYNNNTGIFTAPVSGTYCFIASTGAKYNSHDAGLHIMQGNSAVGYAKAYGDDTAIMATGHAVLHLVAGETVWLKAAYSGEYWREATGFSGVLVTPDA